MNSYTETVSSLPLYLDIYRHAFTGLFYRDRNQDRSTESYFGRNQRTFVLQICSTHNLWSIQKSHKNAPVALFVQVNTMPVKMP